jgi:Domain of unknown function (DUF1905)
MNAAPAQTVDFSAKCWIYSGQGAWHFATLPAKAAAEVAFFNQAATAARGTKRKGWGAIQLEAQIGSSRWATCLFPYKPEQSFILPLKAAVRKTEHIVEGKTVKVRLYLPLP